MHHQRSQLKFDTRFCKVFSEKLHEIGKFLVREKKGDYGIEKIFVLGLGRSPSTCSLTH